MFDTQAIDVTAGAISPGPTRRYCGSFIFKALARKLSNRTPRLDTYLLPTCSSSVVSMGQRRRAPHRHLSLAQSSSASRWTAGAAGFLVFTQSRRDPLRLDTIPSQPRAQACSKSSGPSCSNSASSKPRSRGPGCSPRLKMVRGAFKAHP